ncbi:CYTH domain protein [Rubripirellula lacrimiformis]|uniref:CYTH domain protein n=1 Tax=Rubripirellula lacrimiformis TaxID=1930273 RepID=A0A517NL58_9BACT|nr:class IV adenylate cyclase [Rubripirellula lacrimiformis]QDT07872.1 CYTH domain protein [Rubripirellula lacrimiformis]
MFEVEQKFRVEDADALIRQLQAGGGVEQAAECHSDTYYNHPSRDFSETREALRIRRVDGIPMITYKGTKLPGAIKARRELEWRLDPGDSDGSKMEEMLVLLGFRRVATVHKTRRSFRFPAADPRSDSVGGELTVVVDDVTGLGPHAEIEMLAADADSVEAARDQITILATKLGLRDAESRSYLRMILESGQAE